jgi:hypothetical protein
MDPTGEVIAGGSAAQKTDTPAGGPQRFYRVMLVP